MIYKQCLSRSCLACSHQSLLICAMRRSISVHFRLTKRGSDLNNYRPISNLSFLSKTVERLIDARFVAYAESNSLLYQFTSSPVRTQHSTLNRDNTCSPVQRPSGNRLAEVTSELSCCWTCWQHSTVLIIVLCWMCFNNASMP